MQILAAGGLSLDPTPQSIALLQYIFSLTGKANPKVGFLSQASAENRDYVIKFYEMMLHLGGQPFNQSLFGRVNDGWQNNMLAQDIIFVGGGNTKSMLALWREWGMDQVLRQAGENGTILCGTSAGAICWFEQCVTDSVWPLGTLNGLGFIKGGACPHYDGEPERRPTYLKMVETGQAMAGIALCDYAVAHYVDGDLKQVVTGLPQARAYHLSAENSSVQETEIPVNYIGA